MQHYPTVTRASAAIRARYEHLWQAMHPKLHVGTVETYTACRWEVSLPPSGVYVLTVHRDNPAAVLPGCIRRGGCLRCGRASDGLPLCLTCGWAAADNPSETRQETP